MAGESGDIDLVKNIISHKDIDINVKDKQIRTIIHSAGKSKNLELVKYLISLNKIDIYPKRYKCYTILHSACESGELQICSSIYYFTQSNKYKCTGSRK